MATFLIPRATSEWQVESITCDASAAAEIVSGADADRTAVVVFALPGISAADAAAANRIVGRMVPHSCGDCGAEEGQLHEIGCDQERCPVCGRQALTCMDHCWTRSGWARKRYAEGQRVPHIVTPTYCARCLEPWPAMFHVGDHEWRENVPPHLREQMLCRNCYDLVSTWTQAGREGCMAGDA